MYIFNYNNHIIIHFLKIEDQINYGSYETEGPKTLDNPNFCNWNEGLIRIKGRKRINPKARLLFCSKGEMAKDLGIQILLGEEKAWVWNACDGRKRTKQDSWVIVSHATLNNTPAPFALFVEPSASGFGRFLFLPNLIMKGDQSYPWHPSVFSANSVSFGIWAIFNQAH